MAALLAAVLVPAGALAAPTTGSEASAAPASALASYPFGPSSVWRASVASAPVASTSPAQVKHLTGTVTDRYGGVAAFNNHNYANSYYVATPTTARVDVAFHDCQGKGYVPTGLTGPGGQFTSVPIPAGAVPAAGTDRALSVYLPATDQLWEFWLAERDGSGRWRACWGGRIDAASKSPGYFSGAFGATATGLSHTAGMLSLADVRSGRVEHALSLAIPEPAKAPLKSWPAQRTDGSDPHPAAVPEGTRLRLDPAVDVAALRLHPVAAMVATAAQRHGFIVTDRAGAVAITAESGEPARRANGVDPWVALLGGTPDYAVMKGFPWHRLQALPKDHGKPAS